jgi:hypothetical protein
LNRKDNFAAPHNGWEGEYFFKDYFLTTTVAPNSGKPFLDQKWDQGQRGYTVEPSPAKDSRRSKADHENDRKIAAGNGFNRIGP